MEDKHPVEQLAQDGADETLGKELARGDRAGAPMISIRSEPKTSSKSGVNLASRCRRRDLAGRVRSTSTKLRVRAH
jgi:hypothetical protein